MIRKLIIITTFFILLFLFYSLGKQIYDSLQVDNRLDRESEELVELQKRNLELKKKQAEVLTPQFIEKGARDKLNLSRPGETVIIIPQGEINKVIGNLQGEKEETISNWQGWLRLFWK